MSKPAAGRRAFLRAVQSSAVAVAALLACTGCISITSPDPAATTTAGPPPSYLDRLKAAPVATPSADAQSGTQQGEGVWTFATEDHNIACVVAQSRAGQVNSPWEPNNFDSDELKSSPLVPVVDCQLARYPQPTKAADNCAGTNIGFLGGTVLLAPDTVAYGNCRAGVTAMEAAFGPNGRADGPLAGVAPLAKGQALDALGYRCVPLDDGVACANLSNGVGFYVDRDSYQAFP